MTRSLLDLRRLRVLAAVLALTVLCGWAVPAAGSATACQPPDPCGWSGQTGLQAQLRVVAAVVEPRDDNDGRSLEVYEALLPQGLRMPERPLIGTWLVEATVPRDVPGRPHDPLSKWSDGAVQLRAAHVAADGTLEEGWYPVTYPVDSEFWYQLGIAVGLPKSRSDIAFATGPGSVTATARTQGASGPPSLHLSWTSDDRVADDELVRLAERIGLGPFFTLNKPLEGPDLMRVAYTADPPAPPFGWTPGDPAPYGPEARGRRGDVWLRVDPDIDTVNAGLPRILPAGASLDDVFETSQVVPGVLLDFAVTLGSTSRTIGRGGYPDRPARP
jgi:hypothetical protein